MPPHPLEPRSRTFRRTRMNIRLFSRLCLAAVPRCPGITRGIERDPCVNELLSQDSIILHPGHTNRCAKLGFVDYLLRIPNWLLNLSRSLQRLRIYRTCKAKEKKETH